jgi:hypothetical protein
MCRSPVLASSLLGAACLSLLARGAVAADQQVPSALQSAAAAYASEMRGVVGMQRHFVAVVKAGPMRHTETSDSGILFANGVFVAVEYYRVADDGKAFSAQQLDARTKQTNSAWSSGKVFFKEPYDPRYTADYTFGGAAACAGCAPSVVAVTFHSDLKDAQHGSGTLWIETATPQHVLATTYTPNALPPHATSGTVTERSTSPLAALWYVTRIDQAYDGREAILTGTGSFTGTFDHFRRFPSEAAGLAALNAGTI